MLNIEKIDITTLSENSVADIYYMAEWGLSIHINIEDGPSILFDTGFKLACTYNARVSGIRLSDIDLVVLSHGHSDHTGGLRSVLEQIKYEKPDRDHVEILCHPAAIEPQYVKHTDHYFYRGCPHNLEELKSSPYSSFISNIFHIVLISSWAGIHGSHQHEAGRVD